MALSATLLTVAAAMDSVERVLELEPVFPTSYR